MKAWNVCHMNVYDIFYSKDPRSPVKNVVISAITSKTMNLIWEKPAEPRHCQIDRYMVNYTFANCENPDGLLLGNGTVVTEPSAELTGLRPNWEYTFYVYAFTSPDGEEGDSMIQVVNTTLPDGTDW